MRLGSTSLGAGLLKLSTATVVAVAPVVVLAAAAGAFMRPGSSSLGAGLLKLATAAVAPVDVLATAVATTAVVVVRVVVLSSGGAPNKFSKSMNNACSSSHCAHLLEWSPHVGGHVSLCTPIPPNACVIQCDAHGEVFDT